MPFTPKVLLTVTALDQSKTYDGTKDAVIAEEQITGTGVTVNNVTESVVFKGKTGSYNSQNVVDGKTVTATVTGTAAPPTRT